jgi:hypothetical protein
MAHTPRHTILLRPTITDTHINLDNPHRRLITTSYRINSNLYIPNQCFLEYELSEHTLQNEMTQICTRSVFIWAAVCVSDTERLRGLCCFPTVSY